ncbi:type IB HK, signal transducer activity, partial [Mucor lusitanicus CBS 277.49]
VNQKIAVSILKRLGFQDVIIAGNGREALELMRVHTFDVIFMDLYMPEMDGLEATRYIISERKHNVPPPPILPENGQQQKPLLNVNDVYIIALTASASKQDRQICIDAGMNDFISKPFTMMEMKSALKNCASKRKKRKKQQQLSNENKD